MPNQATANHLFQLRLEAAGKVEVPLRRDHQKIDHPGVFVLVAASEGAKMAAPGGATLPAVDGSAAGMNYTQHTAARPPAQAAALRPGES